MTYDPDRDARAPADISPNRRPYERAGAGLSVALMLALMAAFVAVGFWFYATSDGTTVATGERPAAEQATTGAGSQEPPLPNTPTPPTAPSPQAE
jgi:ferric-dicitrate binding protein FerR (iron transport regulator)